MKKMKKIFHYANNIKEDILSEQGVPNDDAKKIAEIISNYTFPMLDDLHRALGIIRKGL